VKRLGSGDSNLYHPFLYYLIFYDCERKTFILCVIYMVYALGHMSIIYHYGYGYSKKLCEAVTSWYLNNFYPRHKITIEVQHRGLKREGVRGYCDILGNQYRPRSFLIELDTNMDEELYTKTLIHELTHMSQWIRGTLKNRSGRMYYAGKRVDEYDYWQQPHEVEAREDEERLYFWYLHDLVV